MVKKKTSTETKETNHIKIQLNKDKILIKMSQKATYEDILKEVQDKLPKLSKLYQDEKTPIYIVGKNLDNEQMEELEKMITEKIDVEVDFDSPKELGLSGIKKTYEEDLTVSEVKFYKGSVRSGMRMEYEKSIVIMGDVNAGAEIIAGGNIVITGALRGLAHAGAKGNTKAIICARGIETPQVRIANIVKEMDSIPEMNAERCAKQDFAHVENGEIVIN